MAVNDSSQIASLCQDAAGTTPVLAVGDPVGRLKDQSGNGFHLAQTATAGRPLYRTDGSRHWLESDGLDDVLTAATCFGLAANPALAVVAGLRPLSLVDNDDRFLHVGTGSHVLAAGLGSEGLAWRHDGGNARFGAVADGTDQVVSWFRSNGDTYGAQRAAVDGVERTRLASGNAGAQPTNTGAHAAMFDRGTGGAQPAHVRLYGLVVLAGDAVEHPWPAPSCVSAKCPCYLRSVNVWSGRQCGAVPAGALPARPGHRAGQPHVEADQRRSLYMFARPLGGAGPTRPSKGPAKGACGPAPRRPFPATCVHCADRAWARGRLHMRRDCEAGRWPSDAVL